MRNLMLGLLLLTSAAAAATPEWIVRSNALVQPVLEARARFTPEQASFRGMEAFDTQVYDLGPHRSKRERAELETEAAKLRAAREKESDARVRQDLDIVIGALEKEVEASRVENKHRFDYYDAAGTANGGLSVLLDPRNKPERQARALIRLRRYAGTERGYTPIATLARQRTEEGMARSGVAGPYVEEVKQNIADTDILLKGIADLFARDRISGWEADFEVLSRQLRDYRDWQRRNVLPRARAQLTLPPEVYAARVRQAGIDLAPREVMDRAGAEWQEVRTEMEVLAAEVARARHLP